MDIKQLRTETVSKIKALGYTIEAKRYSDEVLRQTIAAYYIGCSVDAIKIKNYRVFSGKHWVKYSLGSRIGCSFVSKHLLAKTKLGKLIESSKTVEISKLGVIGSVGKYDKSGKRPIYQTTVTTCDCPDVTYTDSGYQFKINDRIVCKHQIAMSKYVLDTKVFSDYVLASNNPYIEQISELNHALLSEGFTLEKMNQTNDGFAQLIINQDDKHYLVGYSHPTGRYFVCDESQKFSYGFLVEYIISLLKPVTVRPSDIFPQ